MQEIILKNNQSDYFTLIKYPDGQRSINLDLEKLNIKEPISIKCRIINFSELEVLFCLTSALNKNDFYIEEVNFVYLFGMRSDRSFQVGQPNYSKDIIFPIIRSILSRHCVNKISILYPHNLRSLNTYNFKGYYSNFNYNFFDYFLIAGDESILSFGDAFQAHFKKERKDKIYLDLLCKKSINETSKDLMIVDDLCDGGATFISEGEYIKKLFPNKKISLFVCHGLFTKGFKDILYYFDEIICTNSYQDINHPKVKQIKVI